MRVQRREVPLDVEDPPEVLKAPVLVPERIALEIEEEIARRGIGQKREAALRLRLQEHELVLFVLARPKLELGLFALLLPRVGAETRRRGLTRRASERLERRDPG